MLKHISQRRKRGDSTLSMSTNTRRAVCPKQKSSIFLSTATNGELRISSSSLTPPVLCGISALMYYFSLQHFRQFCAPLALIVVAHGFCFCFVLFLSGPSFFLLLSLLVCFSVCGDRVCFFFFRPRQFPIRADSNKSESCEDDSWRRTKSPDWATAHHGKYAHFVHFLLDSFFHFFFLVLFIGLQCLKRGWTNRNIWPLPFVCTDFGAQFLDRVDAVVLRAKKIFGLAYLFDWCRRCFAQVFSWSHARTQSGQLFLIYSQNGTNWLRWMRLEWCGRCTEDNLLCFCLCAFFSSSSCSCVSILTRGEILWNVRGGPYLWPLLVEFEIWRIVYSQGIRGNVCMWKASSIHEVF